MARAALAREGFEGVFGEGEEKDTEINQILPILLAIRTLYIISIHQIDLHF